MISSKYGSRGIIINNKPGIKWRGGEGKGELNLSNEAVNYDRNQLKIGVIYCNLIIKGNIKLCLATDLNWKSTLSYSLHFGDLEILNSTVQLSTTQTLLKLIS